MLTLDKLFVSIEGAVTEARLALEDADPVDCIAELTTVQLKTAELIATLLTRVQTRGN